MAWEQPADVVQTGPAAHGDNVAQGVLWVTPGPGRPVPNAYRPLLGHLLHESGSSGATGGEQRGLGEEGKLALGPPPFLTLHLRHLSQPKSLPS